MKRLLACLLFLVSPLNAANKTAWITLPDGSQQRMVVTYQDMQDGSHAEVLATPASLSACKASYRAATTAFTPGSTPFDVATITGSASKTVKVTHTCLTGVQTNAGVNSWFIIKRSAANSGGTSTDVTEVPSDSNSEAASATVLNYTVNPTTSSPVGLIWSGKVVAAAPAGSAGNLQGVCVDLTELYGQPIVLRGTGEVLAWNFGGAALPAGLSIHVTFAWTEE